MSISARFSFDSALDFQRLSLANAVDMFSLLHHYVVLFGFDGFTLLVDRILRRILPFHCYQRFARMTWLGSSMQGKKKVFLLLRAPFGQRSKRDRDWLADRFPGVINHKQAAAETICRHVFDFLAAGPRHWGDPIDWHQDVKSGHRWPTCFYAAYGADLTPGHGVDVKVPWELSRCHHLVVLAQAWWLTGDERFARECFAQWESWLASNPWGYGINWVCTMEVAIRAVNWLWAFGLLAGAPGWTPERRRALAQSLWQHATHIEHNLEVGVRDGQIVAANHYLANVCALACLGVLCPELPGADCWRRVGLRALEQEIRRQVLPDGFFFESSTSYHRLAVELFLVPSLLARHNGHEMSTEYWSRLERMLDVILHLTRPDGCVPQIGDNDDGRLLVLSGYPDWPRHDHRYLLALGAVLFRRGDFKAAADDCPEDVFWLLGREGVGIYEALAIDPKPLDSRAFPDGGTYVIRSRDGQDYALVRAGVPALHAPMAHLHNDALSLELWVDGRPVLIDPGTYCYTSDLVERNRFRSTSMHNTVIIDGQEINCILVNQPFYLEQNGQVQVLEWHVGKNEVRLVAQHDGYARLHPPVMHQRTVSYDARRRLWCIKDELAGEGRHTATWHWHFGSDAACAISRQGDELLLRIAEVVAWLEAPQSTWFTYDVRDDVYAPAYGVAERSKCLQVVMKWTERATVAVCYAGSLSAFSRSWAQHDGSTVASSIPSTDVCATAISTRAASHSRS